MSRILVFLVLIIGIVSCTEVKDAELNLPTGKDMVGLAKVMDLKPGLNKILLSDFFLHPDQIDSIQVVDFNNAIFDKKEHTLVFNADDYPKPIIRSHCFIKGIEYTVLFRKSRKVLHKIIFNQGDADYQQVALAGSMNDWNPANAPMSRDGNNWSISLLLNPGKYQYQLDVDGGRILDPDNTITEDNNIGGFNSVLYVKPASDAPKPILKTETFSDDKLNISTKYEVSDLLVLWQNQQVDAKKIVHTESSIEIKIPKIASQLERSFIRVYAYNKSGLGNELLIPLQNGKVVSNVSSLTRSDHEAGILYFLMVDRFKNGNVKNDLAVADPEVLPKANYYGGDIAGVLKKLQEGFFEDLGINTIWLSPITQNTWNAFTEYPEPHRKYSAYHGYWPISFTKVDKRLGSNSELQQLIDEAHQRNINIVLDYVSNHVHQESPMYTEHPEWFSSVDLPNGEKNIRKWDEQRLTTWFDTFLPTIDFANEEVLKVVTDSAMFWLNELGIDGFRHDATKHIPESYWRELTRKVKQYTAKTGKPVYQVGETFGGRELIGSYVGNGMLNGQFDFNLYWDARAVFAIQEESFKKLSKSINETFDYYGAHHLMGNITGNHDMARFISYASGALAFDENSQEAGWNRDIKVETPLGYKRLQCLSAFTMTIPGVPVIYYGDEFGMPGANDPDNRRPMRFDDLTEPELATKAITQQLIKLRKSSMALNYGDFTVLKVNDDEFVYSRNYFNETAVVAFNKSMHEKQLKFSLDEQTASELKAQFGSRVMVDGKIVTVTLPPWSFEVLQ